MAVKVNECIPAIPVLIMQTASLGIVLKKPHVITIQPQQKKI